MYNRVTLKFLREEPGFSLDEDTARLLSCATSWTLPLEELRPKNHFCIEDFVHAMRSKKMLFAAYPEDLVPGRNRMISVWDGVCEFLVLLARRQAVYYFAGGTTKKVYSFVQDNISSNIDGELLLVNMAVSEVRFVRVETSACAA